MFGSEDFCGTYTCLVLPCFSSSRCTNGIRCQRRGVSTLPSRGAPRRTRNSASNSSPVGVPTAAPQNEAQLDDSSRRLEGIVADGLCLYCCILASEDLASWTLTHVSVTNTAHDREVRDRDLSNAKLLRSGFVWFWTTRADRAMQPARLKEGLEGYPDMEDLQFPARMLGGQIVLQTNDAQIVYGDGPLYIHIAYASSVDGAGDNSGHDAIYQSWCELVNRPHHRRVSTTQDEARGMDTEPRHISKLCNPSAQKSSVCCRYFAQSRQINR